MVKKLRTFPYTVVCSTPLGLDQVVVDATGIEAAKDAAITAIRHFSPSLDFVFPEKVLEYPSNKVLWVKSLSSTQDENEILKGFKPLTRGHTTMENKIWARVYEGRPIELIAFDPAGLFNEEIVWVDVPSNIWPLLTSEWLYNEKTKQFVPENLVAFRYQLESKISEIRRFMLSRSINVDGNTFDSDANSVRSIDLEVNNAKLWEEVKKEPYSVRWKTAYNEFVRLNLKQLIAIKMAMTERKNACFDREADLHDLISKLLSKGEKTDLTLAIEKFKSELFENWPFLIKEGDVTDPDNLSWCQLTLLNAPPTYVQEQEPVIQETTSEVSEEVVEALEVGDVVTIQQNTD